MGSVSWPVFIIFALWKALFIVMDKLFQASKLGGIQDPSRWYHWLFFIIAYIIFESTMQAITSSIKKSQ